MPSSPGRLYCKNQIRNHLEQTPTSLAIEILSILWHYSQGQIHFGRYRNCNY